MMQHWATVRKRKLASMDAGNFKYVISCRSCATLFQSVLNNELNKNNNMNQQQTFESTGSMHSNMIDSLTFIRAKIYFLLLKMKIVSKASNVPRAAPSHIAALWQMTKVEAEAQPVIMCNTILLASLCLCHAMLWVRSPCVSLCSARWQRQSQSHSQWPKRKKKKKSFSLIASITLAVVLWDSRPPRLFRMVSFPPWHPWISHITSYRAGQAEAQLDSWHVSAHHHPNPWLCHSQHMPAGVANTRAIFPAGGGISVWEKLPDRNRGFIYGEWRYNVAESRRDASLSWRADPRVHSQVNLLCLLRFCERLQITKTVALTLNSLSLSNPTNSLRVRHISPSLSEGLQLPLLGWEKKERMRSGEAGRKNFSVQLHRSSLDFACGSFNGSQMFSKWQQHGWKCERSRAGEGGAATAGTVIRRPDSDKLHLLTSWLMNKLAPGFSLRPPSLPPLPLSSHSPLFSFFSVFVACTQRC